MHLWESLAIEIISIVGEEGFQSLYTRSVFLAQPAFPWLASLSLSPHTNQRFAQLKLCLQQLTPEQVSAANRLLFITFTDILAALIGEQLTASILHAAWVDDASRRTRKEFKND